MAARGETRKGIGGTSTALWGIAGTGSIAADFASAMLKTDEATLAAVASRDESKAYEFRDKYQKDAAAYGTYEALARDPDVDVVYVAVTNQQHKHLCNLFLNYGKNVVVEKPATLRLQDTRELIQKARSKGLLFLEGLWTFFFPVNRKLMELIEEGHLGRITYISGSMCPGNLINEDVPYEDLENHRRLWDPQLGGSVLYDMGIYPLAMALKVFNFTEPSHFQALSVNAAPMEGSYDTVDYSGLGFSPDVKSGVDIQGAISAVFPGNCFASLRWGVRGEEEQNFVVSGTRGMAVLRPPAHAPDSMKVHYKVGDKAGQSEAFNFSLPMPPEVANRTNYPNSMGFVYEINAVSQALHQGRIEVPEYTHDHMQLLAYMLEKSRKQLNIAHGNVSVEQARNVQKAPSQRQVNASAAEQYQYQSRSQYQRRNSETRGGYEERYA